MNKANFPYKQRGINTYEAAKDLLNEYGRVSIIWEKIPKKHIKAIKELVSNCKEEFVPVYKEYITEIMYTETPAHYDYIKL